MGDIDCFLRIAGIPGDSREPLHRDEIEVASWSWGISRASTPAPGGITRPQFQEVSIVKAVDRASPLLAESCAGGRHFQDAVLTATRALGQRAAFDFLVLRLTDITITRFGESTDDHSMPTESISIQYSKVEHRFTPQKIDGTLEPVLGWAWDLKTNSKV